MSNDTTKARPTHRIYSVMGNGPKAIWQCAGAAFPQADGQGLNLSSPRVRSKAPRSCRMLKERQAAMTTARTAAVRAPEEA